MTSPGWKAYKKQGFDSSLWFRIVLSLLLGKDLCRTSSLITSHVHTHHTKYSVRNNGSVIPYLMLMYQSLSRKRRIRRIIAAIAATPMATSAISTQLVVCSGTTDATIVGVGGGVGVGVGVDVVVVGGGVVTMKDAL